MADIDRANYPSNSNRSKIEKKPVPPTTGKSENHEVKKVVKGAVSIKKKTFGERFSETFLGDDLQNVISYVLHDVVIPAAKTTLSEMVSGGLEMLLFGERQGSRTTRDGNKSYVNYNGYSNNRSRDVRREPTLSYRDRASHNFGNISFSNRGDAEDVLSQLADMIDQYDVASVADLYNLIGTPANFTDEKYGWTNLSTANVSRARDGWRLNLPRTVVID